MTNQQYKPASELTLSALKSIVGKVKAECFGDMRLRATWVNAYNNYFYGPQQKAFKAAGNHEEQVEDLNGDGKVFNQTVVNLHIYYAPACFLYPTELEVISNTSEDLEIPLAAQEYQAKMVELYKPKVSEGWYYSDDFWHSKVCPVDASEWEKYLYSEIVVEPDIYG